MMGVEVFGEDSDLLHEYLYKLLQIIRRLN